MLEVRYGGVVAGEDEVAAVTRVLRGQGWACGERAAELERRAAAVQGRRHALFVNSGSSALLLALSCLPRGSRVAMPALQFPTLYSAAIWCGLEPVLVDVDGSLNMGLEALDRHALAGLDAVAFVHVAGNPANAAEVSAWCRTHDAVMIEDICEGFGGLFTVTGRKTGSHGHLVATSTHAAHQVATGEGGIVFVDNETLFQKMRRIRDWGRAYDESLLPGYYPGYVFSEHGLNLHGSDIAAALGLVQLSRMTAFRDARDGNYRFFRRELAGLPLEFPRVIPGTEPAWFTFPMLADERDKLSLHLAERGVETRPLLCGNLARQPLPGMPDPGLFPVADDAFRRGLWFSVHPSLTQEQRQHVVASVREFFA